MSHESRVRRWAIRLVVRMLLTLYPKSFRRRFRSAFAETVDHAAVEPAFRGPRGFLRLVRWLIADTARAAPGEWRDRPKPPRRSSNHPRHRMDILRQDIRYALRGLRRSPAFTAAVIGSLALGIGANTVVFTALDGLVLHPFAFPEPDRLLAVGVTLPETSGRPQFIETFAAPEFVDIREQVRSLTRVSAFDLGNRAISGGEFPERLFTAFVWGDPLATLGLQPELGRSFTNEETTTPGHAVVLLSHRAWTSRFAADPKLVGGTVRVNGVQHTVIGILPPQALLFATDLWMPMGTDPELIPRHARQFAILGRMSQGATRADVDRELAALAQRTTATHAAELPLYARWQLHAVPWAEAVMSRSGIRTTGFFLQGAVALVLLIACVNVAGLLTARAISRRAEVSVRRALGAPTARLTRQLLTEGIVLSVAGAAIGVALALAVLPAVNAALPTGLANLGVAAHPNPRVLLFTAALATVVGLAFGLAPALSLRGTGWLGWLGSPGSLGSLGSASAAARTTTGKAGRRSRAAFLATQVAISVVLLVAAGLLVRSLRALQAVDLGFPAENVLRLRLTVPLERYAPREVVPFIDRVSEQLAELPGVLAVGAATQYAPGNGFSAPFAVVGDEGPAEALEVDVTNATPGYFAALGYRLESGRSLEPTDDERAPTVALLNQTAARRYFAGRSPIGERIRLGDAERSAEVEIVGVVADARNRGLDEPVAPEVFVPARQQNVQANNQFFMLVRTAGDPLAIVPAVRRAIRELDPEQPAYAIGTIESELGENLSSRRAAMVFLLVFAGIAVALACVGIYGLATQLVAERVREIGIRIALGAAARDVGRLVLRQTLVVVAIGGATGLVAAIAAAGLMRSLVFGVSPNDPLTLVVVAVLVPLVAVAAGAIPTRRATRIDPVTALREG